MRETQSGNVGHAGRCSDRVTLQPELFGDESNGRPAASSYFDSVTHGAGGAAASMAVGRDDSRTCVGDRQEMVLAGRRAGVSFVEVDELDAGQLA